LIDEVTIAAGQHHFAQEPTLKRFIPARHSATSKPNSAKQVFN